VANPQDHDYLIDAALAESNLGASQVKDEDGRAIGMWAALGKVKGGAYRMTPLGTIFRNSETGEVMTDESGNLLPQFLPADPKERTTLQESFYTENGDRNVQSYFEGKLGIKSVDILMSADDGYNVRGDHVDAVAGGFDERGFPSIDFIMTAEGAILFQGLTGENAPDPQTGFKRRLGILMDNALISAPELRSMISRNGQITGRFTQEEVDDLVQIIRGGSLEAVLSPQPTTESQISPLLGGVTIRQSMVAMAISLAFTLVVLAFYYRFAGLVACAALLANLAMTLAVMILLKASFTLPGIAGLILSVGMSVDANILIFERIREELARGAKMRMALRNGFARATTTIVDSNVTTLIAGLVLYVIGTDVIRGFAVTLNLGLLMSMFTAVFCSKVIFEIGERRRWYRDLRLAHDAVGQGDPHRLPGKTQDCDYRFDRGDRGRPGGRRGSRRGPLGHRPGRGHGGGRALDQAAYGNSAPRKAGPGKVPAHLPRGGRGRKEIAQPQRSRQHWTRS
jgi:SecD/SecF fusion protein